jgi:hypothetical protein
VKVSTKLPAADVHDLTTPVGSGVLTTPFREPYMPLVGVRKKAFGVPGINPDASLAPTLVTNHWEPSRSSAVDAERSEPE